MLATVAVPTWRRPAWLARCLAALGRQTRTPDEALVIGRHDDVESAGVARAEGSRAPFPVRWITVNRAGHVAPVARGLEVAGGDVVAFLDDDAEPEPGWLAALLEPFGNPEVGCVGGRVRTPGFCGRVHRDAGRVRWYGRHIGNVAALGESVERDVDGVMEGNWAWRVDVLRRLAFDPMLDFDDASMYGLDLTLQARARGYRVVFAPAAEIVHHAAPRDPRLDRADRARRVFAYCRNYTYIACKHFRGARRIAFTLWWWGVGERGAYGLATAAADALLRPAAVRRLLPSAMAGRREGIRAWRAR